MNYLNELQKIIRVVLDNDDLIITPETIASEVEDWDSLAQINIIIACESFFQVKFEMSEIQKLKNVGEMLKLIEEKKATNEIV